MISHLQIKQREQDLAQINIQVENMKNKICQLSGLAVFKENQKVEPNDHEIVKENLNFLKKNIFPMQKKFLDQLEKFKELLEQIKNLDNIQFYTNVENMMSDFYKVYSFFHAQIKYYLERKSILNSEDSDADLRLIQDIIN